MFHNNPQSTPMKEIHRNSESTKMPKESPQKSETPLDYSTFYDEFNAKIPPLEARLDLTAKLICTRRSDDDWELNCSHIRGQKVSYLLGRNYENSEQLPLDSLLTSDFKAQHPAYVASVLNQGKKSPYWTHLFDNMMRNPIHIRSPLDGSPRLVKIIMKLDSIDIEETPQQYIFDLVLTDQTIENAIANKAGGITHDMRGLISAAKNTVGNVLSGLTRDQFIRLSPEELRAFFDAQTKENLDVVHVLQESLSLCKASREDFTPRAFIHDKNEIPNNTPDSCSSPADEIPKFLLAAKANHPKERGQACELLFTGHPDTLLEQKKIHLLERFLLNLIHNAIKASATRLDIDFTEEQGQFICDVTDNGSGMAPELASHFFSREMPQKSAEHQEIAIECNRGEGALIAYQQWASCGGSATITTPKSATQGTRFILSIPASYPCLFFKKTSGELNSEQSAMLERITHQPQINNLVLLVDDSLVQIKTLVNQIKRFLGAEGRRTNDSMQSIKSDQWQKQGLALNFLGNSCIISAANGDIAYSILKKLPHINAMITDQQMPGLNGLELMKQIRHDQINIPNIALNTGDCVEQMSEELKSQIKLLGVSILHKGDTAGLHAFFDRMFTKRAESDQSIGLR